MRSPSLVGAFAALVWYFRIEENNNVVLTHVEPFEDY